MSKSHRLPSNCHAAGRLVQPLQPTRSRPAASRNAAGISLVECCFCLAILGILVAWGSSPSSYVAQMWRQRALSLEAQRLQSSLLVARSEAIKSRERTVVCKSADGQRCTPDGAWSQGWIVFRDLDNNAQREDGEPLLVNQRPPSLGVNLSGNAPVARYVSFQPDGSAATVGGAFQAGSFTACSNASTKVTPQQLVISATGRTRIQSAASPACG
jgi:type IV fimbrial biogenesis protein FimT